MSPLVATSPAVYSDGGHFIYPDDQQTPNTQQVIFDYGDAQVVFEVRGLPTGGEANMTPPTGAKNTVGNIFFGSDGYMTVGLWGFKTFLGEGRQPGPSMAAVEGPGGVTTPHIENFLEAVRSRKVADLHCDVEVGHLSAALCHMANISYRVERKLRFDLQTETFPGDDEANKMLTRNYREPYVVPDKV